MVRTRGGHDFRPRVCPSSSPLTTGLSFPPTATAAASPAPDPVPIAPTPHRHDTRVGPTPPSPSHPRPSRRAPPLTRARESHLVRGPKSLIHHLFRGQLMTSPHICLLLLLSDVPSSITAPLQAIQIAVPRKCTTRHIMIFQPLLQIPSSEIP